jgi:hypothetical protein
MILFHLLLVRYLILVILDFTRAMDSSADWETKKDAEKRARYAPVLDFFNSLPENQGWTLLQFNFTVGVRGSISNLDRTEPFSFLSTLKALGITSRANLEKFARRPLSALSRHVTFYSEATPLQNLAPLLLERTFQASSKYQSILGNAFAFQHCLRPSK